ncbi:MAG TPA: sigma-70 family RNA polymerase sigma factor [Acidimicrobiales bacterium]|nr:sigma-70 family RNA polymerase sigma factor [Acidimicrobiales bacterium]
MTDHVREFDDFFRTNCPRLVGQAYVYTGVLAEAQDLAHESLTRAWERWGVVRQYDDPAAWTRKVLRNLATSEWRRAEVRRTKSRPPVDIEGPDVEALALAQALKLLPTTQRHAVVLHDAIGIPVADVARELDVPEGTVRSWLSRGRKILARELGLDDDYEGGAQHG